MDPNTAEIVEELDVAEEEQVSDEELMAALEDELAAVEPEPGETEDAADKADSVPETEGSDEPDGEPEVEAEAVTDEEPKPEEPKAEEPKAEEPKAESKPEEKAEKPSDEFGTLEDSVPEKTRERFEAIKTKYDAIAQERDTVKAEADKWVEAVTSTGTNPEQFGMALTWLRKLNSRDPKELEDAYQIMLNEVQTLGKTLGKPLPGVYDPLDDYPDLKSKVDDGLMDESAAHEVAQARAMGRLSESSRQSEQQSVEEKKIYDNTMNEVRQFGAELQQSDPYFNQKMQYLEPIITAAVSSGAPPQNWLKIIKGAYEKLPNPVAAAPTPPKPHVPDPIRPGGTTPATNSMEKEPGNELEALNQALARGW